MALPYCDDFNDGNANGWRVQSGPWYVQSNAYVAWSGDAGMNCSTLNNSRSVDTRITVDVTDLNTGPNNNFHVMFGYKSLSDSYFAGCWLGAGKWVIGRYINGAWDTYASYDDPETRPGYSGTVQVRLKNGSISVISNGVQKVAYTPPSPISDGQVGLAAIRSGVRFDNVCVEP